MLRRQLRLRREFLRSKANEEVESAISQRKRVLKDATDNGKTIPGSLRGADRSLRPKLDLEDAKSLSLAGNRSVGLADSEYAQAGVSDPVVMVTTSRDPGRPVIQFAKELSLMIPNAKMINRGGYTEQDLVTLAEKNGISDIIEISGRDKNGKPTLMEICHMPYGPTVQFNITNIVTRLDFKKVADQKLRDMPRVSPHLIFHNFESKLGHRISDVLKYIFPVPNQSTPRIVSFINHSDKIYIRNHFCHDQKKFQKKQSEGAYDNITEKDKFHKADTMIELEELGPRFTLTPFRVIRNTIQNKDQDVEWSKAHYINKRKGILS